MINLFLMDMTNGASINGVDRYLECLTDGLKHYPDINVHWINLVKSDNALFIKTEKTEKLS